MTENMQLFLKKASEDKELAQKVSEEKDINVLIAIAKDLGITLTEEEFNENTAPNELSDDEIDAVTGGSDVACACALGGGGTKDNNDKTCACVLAGAGYTRTGRERCVCGFAGYGYDS